MCYLESISEGAVIVSVQDGCDASEHLEEEGLAVEDVELLAGELDGRGDQFVRLVVGVNSKETRHHQKVPKMTIVQFRIDVHRKENVELYMAAFSGLG